MRYCEYSDNDNSELDPELHGFVNWLEQRKD